MRVNSHASNSHKNQLSSSLSVIFVQSLQPEDQLQAFDEVSKKIKWHELGVSKVQRKMRTV